MKASLQGDMVGIYEELGMKAEDEYDNYMGTVSLESLDDLLKLRNKVQNDLIIGEGSILIYDNYIE